MFQKPLIAGNKNQLQFRVYKKVLSEQTIYKYKNLRSFESLKMKSVPLYWKWQMIKQSQCQFEGKGFNNTLVMPNSTSPQTLLASLLITSFHLLTFSQAIKEKKGPDLELQRSMCLTCSEVTITFTLRDYKSIIPIHNLCTRPL